MLPPHPQLSLPTPQNRTLNGSGCPFAARRSASVLPPEGWREGGDPLVPMAVGRGGHAPAAPPPLVAPPPDPPFERWGVPVRRPPLRQRAAPRMVHILPPGRHLPHRPTPHIAHDERLRPQPPHQLQVLVRPETVVLGYSAPDGVHHLGPLRRWPDPVLPMVVVGEAAAGPAQVGDLDLAQRLADVVAQPPRPGGLAVPDARRD